MDEYVVEWRSNVPQSDWNKYPWLPVFTDAVLATVRAEQAAIEWSDNRAKYEFRVRYTTTEFIKIEVQ